MLFRSPDYTLLTSDVTVLQRDYGIVLQHSGRKDPNLGLPPYVGLMDAAYLLNALGDDLTAHCHIKGAKALSHLNKLAATRNRSVLAHGEQAVKKADCEELGRKARLVLRAYWDDREGGPPVDDIVGSLRFVRADR